MKKNIRLNKQIIKALSIGISAGMLLQPVSAYAAENEGTDPETPAAGTGVATTVPADQASTAADYVAAENLADEADDKVEETVEAYQEAVDIMTAVSDNEKLDTKVWNAVTDLQTAIDDNKDKLESDCDNAEQVVKDMKDKADEVALWDVSANSLKDKAEADVSAGEDAVKKAEKLAEDTNDAIDVLAADVSANIAAIANSSYNDAVTYYNRAVSDGNAADAVITQAETDYAVIKQEYETAKTDFEKKDAAYNDAVKAYNDARAEFEQLRADAISGNDSYVRDALNKLQILEAKANELKDKADAASQELMDTSARYIAIGKNEQKVLEAESDNTITVEEWNKTLDDLFAAMMKYYVIPDMFNGVADDSFSVTWIKDNSNQKNNYCVVTYKKNGVVVSEDYNYILSQKDNKGVGFVIFRKNGNESNNVSLNKDNIGNNFVLAEYDNPDGEPDYHVNYKPKNLNQTQAKDTEEFRNKVDANYGLNVAYTDLLKKLGEAQGKYDVAKDRVEKLEKEIGALKLSADADFQELKKLEGDLTKAERRLDDAKQKRDEIKEQIDNIVLPNPPEEPNPGPVVPDQPNPEPVNPNPEPVNPAPAAPILFTAPAPAAPVLELEEEDTPLVEAPQDVQAEDEIEVTDDQTALAAAPITVSDDTTPLASMPEETEMSWWWLLIILVLGATGAEMYRRYMAKKKAAEINTKDVK